MQRSSASGTAAQTSGERAASQHSEIVPTGLTTLLVGLVGVVVVAVFGLALDSSQTIDTSSQTVI